jgi:hypothetical protein
MAVKWTEDKIKEIYSTKIYEKGKDLDEFWCSWICSMRYNCPHSDRYIE